MTTTGCSLRKRPARAAAFMLALIMALALLPVTAKEVKAASYPTMDEITFNGKRGYCAAKYLTLK